MFFVSFTSSLRRSSVRGGMLIRMTFPSLFGFTESSDFWIAFSIAGSTDRSQGWMITSRASGMDSVATWFRGTLLP